MAFTFFFRDAQSLELAIESALLSILGQASIRVWDAGCAHGPETYTLAILLRQRLSEAVFRNVQIHATDRDAAFGDQVARGIFRAGELRRLPPLVFERFFRPAEQHGEFEAIDALRARVRFERHDLLSLRAPRNDFSLVVCKNVLLHFSDEQRSDVLRMLHAALRDDGVLVLEHTQKLPTDIAPLFRPVAAYAQVFRKVAVLPRQLRGHEPHDSRARASASQAVAAGNTTQASPGELPAERCFSAAESCFPFCSTKGDRKCFPT